MEKKIYRLNDDISFRKCSLSEGIHSAFGDCTNFSLTTAEDWTKKYECRQEGIHYHCTKHPEIELEEKESEDYYEDIKLTCPRCKNEIRIKSYPVLRMKCLQALNREIFKGATLIRLDDWYTLEIKEKVKPTPDYRLTTNIKTDKDGDTIVVLYVSYVGTGDKVQYFIKPEKGQLTSDHKDLDPAKIISKIEVTLKDRTLMQTYNEEQ